MNLVPSASGPQPDPTPARGAYKVDISRGQNIARVSSEWFSRPGDERFLSLTALHEAVLARAPLSRSRGIGR